MVVAKGSDCRRSGLRLGFGLKVPVSVSYRLRVSRRKKELCSMCVVVYVKVHGGMLLSG